MAKKTTTKKAAGAKPKAAKKKKLPDHGLTPQMLKFAIEYADTSNGTKSAINAGYGEAGAATQSCRLLRNVKVQDFVSDRLDIQAMSKGEIAVRLADQARSSVEPFIKIDDAGVPCIDMSSENSKASLHLIKEIKIEKKTFTLPTGADIETITTTLKLHDQQNALIQLAKMHGMYEKDNRRVFEIDFSIFTETDLEETAKDPSKAELIYINRRDQMKLVS